MTVRRKAMSKLLERFHLVKRVSFLNSLPIRRVLSGSSSRSNARTSSVSMKTMNSRISISAAMTVTVASNVHRQASVRLDDFVVAGSKTFGEGLGAVGVVACLTDIDG
jgi:hypothetical protein